jgi:uncharacterized protein
LIAVDTNVLVYAHREDSPFHTKAFKALSRLCASPASWAIPWPCVHEFLAIVTHPRIYSPPSTLSQAIDQVEAWMEAPNLLFLSESANYWLILKGDLNSGLIVGPKVHDARVAAICRQHGVSELWSADRDFGRFGQLSTHNPLTGPLS